MATSDPESDESTVLVVDDEHDTADVYTDILSDEYEVKTAYSGKRALEVVDSDIDVVLLDRRMPGLSGDEVLKQIRDREIGCRIVMVTAVDPDIDIVDLDFDDYLVKPVMGEELRDAVERMLLRDAHDAKIQEMVAVASKMATLETKMEIQELEASSEYRALESQFESLRDEVKDEAADGDLYPEFTTEKIRSLLGM